MTASDPEAGDRGGAYERRALPVLELWHVAGLLGGDRGGGEHGCELGASWCGGAPEPEGVGRVAEASRRCISGG